MNSNAMPPAAGAPAVGTAFDPAASVGTVVQRTAHTLTLNGKSYRFGRVGLHARVTTNGEGMRKTTPTVQRTIVAAGGAVVTR